jgi:hypothetical protein
MTVPKRIEDMDSHYVNGYWDAFANRKPYPGDSACSAMWQKGWEDGEADFQAANLDPDTEDKLYQAIRKDVIAPGNKRV